MKKKTNELFDPVLVKDLVNKVKGKSSLARLSNATPIPFTGAKSFVFSFDKEVDIVGEGGTKSEGGIEITPVVITPLKFEYGARVTEEFLTASEEEQLEVLEAFNDGFANKIARGLDIAAFHGFNPRTGNEAVQVGNNCFDKAVKQKTEFAAGTADKNIDTAVKAVMSADGACNGIAMSYQLGSALADLSANDVVDKYGAFRFGGSPETFYGMLCDVNNTVHTTVTGHKMHGYVGDFANGFKWGYAKDVKFEIIPYGDPDNSGSDLKSSGQIYLRSEIYIGWGIIVPEWFAMICESDSMA